MNINGFEIFPKPNDTRFIDIDGQKFGRLTVLGYTRVPAKSRRSVGAWVVQCTCGTIKVCKTTILVNGDSRSCGCLLRAASSTRLYKHGGSRGGDDRYNVWKGIRERCNNPRHGRFKRYGGRGLKVCDRWNDFALFCEDMGPRPSPQHSIERIDNDKGYSPENCRWATNVEQANNRVFVRPVAFGERVQSLKTWCRELNLDYGRARSQVRYKKHRAAEVLLNLYVLSTEGWRH